jgi:nitrogen fixation NifU-like protein
MMRGDESIDLDALGDLEALSGVRKFPVRIKCATLAWHTLAEALTEAASG